MLTKWSALAEVCTHIDICLFFFILCSWGIM